MIYYGLQILNPTIFLFAACIVSAVVSLATGSSWSTVATLGVALLGIGRALGIPDGVIGGAIISGAYFGDKMSPLSDTTNLAPAMAGTDLFTHIRYMAYTTIPSITITLIIFLVIGLRSYSGNVYNDITPVYQPVFIPGSGAGNFSHCKKGACFTSPFYRYTCRSSQCINFSASDN